MLNNMGEDKVVVSVIMPCYNQGEFVAEAIDSVLAQTYPCWELIVMNDGSSDHSERIILEYVQKDKRIKYFCQENAGVVVARNQAIKHAQGKYLLPLDADDKISNDYLERGVTYLDGHPECTLFYCHADYFGGVNEPFPVEYEGYPALLLVNKIFCTSLFRKEHFDLVGGYSTDFMDGYEDWEFFIRLLYHRDCVYQDEKTCFYYRRSERSRNDEANQKFLDLRKRVYMKHVTIYDEYWGDFFSVLQERDGLRDRLKNELRHEEETVKWMELQYQNAVHSKSYQLGYALLHPLEKLKNLFL